MLLLDALTKIAIWICFCVALVSAISLDSQRQQRQHQRQRLAAPTPTTASAVVARRGFLFSYFIPQVALAACLPGDLSPDCIGVYKVPLGETNGASSMIGTEEALKRNAPDIRYVPPVAVPSTARDAIDILLSQRRAADDIRDVVMAGKLEEAGIKVLNLTPKVTVAGRTIVDDRMTTFPQDASEAVRDLQRQRIQSKLDMLLVEFNQLDMLIGQGIRGQLGVSAVAQLSIITELKEAIEAFDDFLAEVSVQR